MMKNMHRHNAMHKDTCDTSDGLFPSPQERKQMVTILLLFKISKMFTCSLLVNQRTALVPISIGWITFFFFFTPIFNRDLWHKSGYSNSQLNPLNRSLILMRPWLELHATSGIIRTLPRSSKKWPTLLFLYSPYTVRRASLHP